VPERVTHRIAYALAADSTSTVMIGLPEVDGPEVAIDRRPAIVIKPPLKGDGWLASSGCCKPNVHRDLRIAIDGRRIETAETFAIDWARVRNDRIYDGDGSKNEQHYAFGADVLAVADGTVVSIQDGKPETTPNVPMIPEAMSDFGGNHVILEIASNVFALYLHLQAGSLTVKVGDVAKAGSPLAKIGNSGPSLGPHLHFGLSNRPNFFAGRSLPFVFDSFTLVGAVDLETSEGERLVISPASKQVRSTYPLYGGIQNYP
jgi:Peptidase family M23